MVSCFLQSDKKTIEHYFRSKIFFLLLFTSTKAGGGPIWTIVAIVIVVFNNNISHQTNKCRNGENELKEQKDIKNNFGSNSD